MKVIRYERFGGPEVLHWVDYPAPPGGKGKVVVEVRAAGVNPIDVKMRAGLFPNIELPFVPGFDISGVVKGGEGFASGEEVFGMIPMSEGGGYAEEVSVDAHLLTRKPSNLSHDEAAAVPLAALTAWQALKEHGKLQRGQRVLVNGASGGVGLFAIQLAKLIGAEVTAVCSDTSSDLVFGVGAGDRIDYDQEDFTRGDERYALVFDVVGSSSAKACRRILQRGGRYVTLIEPKKRNWLGPRPIWMVVYPSGKQMERLAGALSSGALRPVIDSTFPLQEAQAAHRRMEEGHLRGKVVLVR